MAVVLEHRRFNSTVRLTITPAAGEFVFDTDVRKIFAGDGSTIGGIPADGALTTGNNTTSYSILETDVGKSFVFTNNSGSIAIALAQASSDSGKYFPDGSLIWISNQSPSKILTITATTSTINGSSTLVLNPGDSARILSDGTNYWAIKCVGSSVGSLAGLSDVLLTSPTNGQSLVYNSGASKWENSSSTAGGLYSPILGTVPTQSNTGLTTYNSSGTVSKADVATGIKIDVNGNGYGILQSSSVPSTPYTKTALFDYIFNSNTGVNIGLGWSDGTKYEMIQLNLGGSPTAIGVTVDTYSNASTYVATVGGAVNNLPLIATPIFLQISDDGTNVSFSWSKDGVTMLAFYTVAKSSGYLGSGGYTQLVYWVHSYNLAHIIGTLLAWF